MGTRGRHRRERKSLFSPVHTRLLSVLAVGGASLVLLVGGLGGGAESTGSTLPPSSDEPGSTSSTLSGDVDETPTGPLVIRGADGETHSGLMLSNSEGSCLTVEGSRDIRLEIVNLGPCKDDAIRILDSSDVVVAGRLEASESTAADSSESASDALSEQTSSPTTTPTTLVQGVVNGPLVLRGVSGEVVSGVHVSNPSGPCVTVVGSDSVRLEDVTLGPCGGEAIEVRSSSNVVILNSLIEDAAGVGVYSWDVAGLRVSGVEFSRVGSGVIAVESSSVVVETSQFWSAGRNFVQFDKVTGAGNRVTGNVGANGLGASNAEDFISIYKSSGTSNSPILVSGNRFRDGGPSGSGSGIMVGDGGGSHIVVSGNLLVNPGQVGIGVASGENIRVIDNKVFSDSWAWSNVGIYVWNQYPSPCGAIEVSGNEVNWTNSAGRSNGGWNSATCGTVAGWADNDWNAPLTVDIW